MKNEDRIVELLAEYMQKTDRILDEMAKNGKANAEFQKIFQNQLNRMDVAYQIIVGHSEKIEGLQKECKELRSESLKYSIQNDVILKEILSISKRVNDLEVNSKL